MSSVFFARMLRPNSDSDRWTEALNVLRALHEECAHWRSDPAHSKDRDELADILYCLTQNAARFLYQYTSDPANLATLGQCLGLVSDIQRRLRLHPNPARRGEGESEDVHVRETNQPDKPDLSLYHTSVSRVSDRHIRFHYEHDTMESVAA